MAVLVLESLAVQRGTAGCAAQQKAFAHHIGGGPDHVAHALEAEHGIKDVKRNVGMPCMAVGGAGGGEGGCCAVFVDAFLQDLACFGFLVFDNGNADFQRRVQLSLLVPDLG
jgi:hypothetical protein